MLKKKAKISVFLLITIIIISLISTNILKTSKINPVENIEDKLNQISTPKLSDAPVIEIWNLQSGSTFTNKIAMSSDGEYIALVTDSNITLFNKSSTIPMWTYNEPSFSVGMSSNGKYILASRNQYAFLLNSSIESPKTAVWTYNSLNSVSSATSISENGEAIVFVYNYNISFFNNEYSSGNKAHEWSILHPDNANWKSIKISADGKYLVYGSSDDCVYFFNTSAPATYELKFNTSADVSYVDISNDGKYIVAGNEQNEVYLLNTTNYQNKAMWNYTCPSTYQLAALGISAKGNHIVIGYNHLSTPISGTLCQFNNTYFTGNKIPIWSYVYGIDVSISSIAISSDESYIVAGYSYPSTSVDCTVLLNTTVTVPKTKIWKGAQSNNPNANSVAISSNGEYFASLDTNGDDLYFFYHDVPKTSTTQLQKLWEYENINTINDLEISKIGEYVAVAIGKNITLFDKYSNKTIWSFVDTGISDMVDIDISYDGTYVIGSTDADSQVFFLNNTASGAPWNPLEMWKFPSIVGSGRWYGDMSNDGQKIVVASDMNLTTHILNKSFSGDKKPEKSIKLSGYPRDIAISGDGNYFVVAIINSIYLYNTSNPSTYEWSFDTTNTVKKVDIGYDITKNIYYIAAVNDDNEIYLLNHTDKDPKTAMWNFSITTGTVNDIEISDNGKYIVVGENSGYVYILNNKFSTDKTPEWKSKRSPDRKVESVDVSSDGRYIVAGYSTTYSPDWGLVQLFDTSAADPDEPIWWDLTKSVSLVAISGLGDHIAVATPNPHIYLYYRYVYIPPVIYILIGDDDGGDDEEVIPTVPFGNYYLIIVAISVISLIVLKKRKFILKVK